LLAQTPTFNWTVEAGWYAALKMVDAVVLALSSMNTVLTAADCGKEI
jgi:hypothetical protein